MNRTFNVALVGIGGQGVLLLSRILASAAQREYEHVTRTESRGLSQRGGSVNSDLRFGDRPMAPVIARSAADLIVALDLLEATRFSNLLRTDGVIVASDTLTAPLHLQYGKTDADRAQTVQLLKTNCHAQLKTFSNFNLVELSKLEGIPERIHNLVVLGAACRFLPLSSAQLVDEIVTRLPQQQATCIPAFELGRTLKLASYARVMERSLSLATPEASPA